MLIFQVIQSTKLEYSRQHTRRTGCWLSNIQCSTDIQFFLQGQTLRWVMLKYFYTLNFYDKPTHNDWEVNWMWSANDLHQYWENWSIYLIFNVYTIWLALLGMELWQKLTFLEIYCFSYQKVIQFTVGINRGIYIRLDFFMLVTAGDTYRL